MLGPLTEPLGSVGLGSNSTKDTASDSVFSSRCHHFKVFTFKLRELANALAV